MKIPQVNLDVFTQGEEEKGTIKLDKLNKRRLSFWQIWNMNIGFLGIQFSFGLQQTAVNPIFSFLGAHYEQLPLLNLAGPVTGLVIQPLIGAVSDKTWSMKWGRRKPYFLTGAILASLCLLAFPLSPVLWFAVGLLWILDAANNTAMEPYRAFVGDVLPDEQYSMGFQMQSLFVGAGIVLANASIFLFQAWLGGGKATNMSGTIPGWLYYSFFLGALASVSTILWSVLKTPEPPPSEKEIKEIQEFNKYKSNQLVQILSAVVVIFSVPLGLGLLIAYFLFPVLLKEYNVLVVVMLFIAFLWLYTLFKMVKRDKKSRIIVRIEELLGPIMEVTEAISEMPRLLRQLTWVYFFQWYALFIYWQFVAPMSVESMKISESAALGQAAFMNMVYNATTMVVALVLVPFANKFGNKRVYAVSLFLTGIAMFSMPFIQSRWLMVLPMIFFGIGWAAMMGIPYSMVSEVIPQERRGVYMGIINMMIVVPMLIETISFGPIIKSFLNNSAINAILFGGVFFIIAGILALFLKNHRLIRN